MRFSIVIPTRDRAEYLEKTLLTCTMQTYSDLDVIVSDDASSDATREVVQRAAARDPRIRYVTPGRPVGMRDNFEFALTHVEPGFVMALGSDDGLLPHAIEGIREALFATGKDLLTWATPVFNYAGVKTPASQLICPTGSGLREVSSDKFLARQSRDLSYVTDVEFPMIYVKGVVSTHLVDRVRDRSPDRRFYTCSTPDGYSGIVLAGEVDSFAFSRTPFSIFGASPTSQGIAYLSGDPEAKKQSEQFFNDVSGVPMHRDLASQPYSPLISVMTADFLLHARDLPGWPARIPNLSYGRLLRKAVNELSHGLYSVDRVVRELRILSGIAQHHGLIRDFRRLVSGTRRYVSKSAYVGSGVRPGAALFDGHSFRLHDIVDAAFFAATFANASRTVGLGSSLSMLRRSLTYRLKSLRRGERFPDDSLWL